MVLIFYPLFVTEKARLMQALSKFTSKVIICFHYSLIELVLPQSTSMVKNALKGLPVVMSGLLAWPGFRLMYGLSDFLFFWVYYIFKYRRKVVSMNLKMSFPEMTGSQLKYTERKYYSHLCDISLEAFKTARMSAEELRKRMVIRNPEVVNRYYEEGRSVILVAMHYASWEWLLHMPLSIRHHHFFVYKPLHNEGMDHYLNSIRSRFGGETVPMNIALRKIMEAEKNHRPVITWLAADQTPPWFNSFWTLFLNQETSFFDGPAKLAQRFNHPVIFQGVRKTGRGYYETWFEVLAEEPRSLTEEEIVLRYVARMEEIIREEPEWYVWSHRRWKHKRPAEAPLRQATLRSIG